MSRIANGSGTCLVGRGTRPFLPPPPPVSSSPRRPSLSSLRGHSPPPCYVCSGSNGIHRNVSNLELGMGGRTRHSHGGGGGEGIEAPLQPARADHVFIQQFSPRWGPDLPDREGSRSAPSPPAVPQEGGPAPRGMGPMAMAMLLLVLPTVTGAPACESFDYKYPMCIL